MFEMSLIMEGLGVKRIIDDKVDQLFGFPID
jgi:hypothetical protein